MEHQTKLAKTAWVLALCVASGLLFSACKSACTTPTTSEHPQKEHPEHPQAPAEK